MTEHDKFLILKMLAAFEITGCSQEALVLRKFINEHNKTIEFIKLLSNEICMISVTANNDCIECLATELLKEIGEQ